MLAFPTMLIPAAVEAGMKVPEDGDGPDQPSLDGPGKIDRQKFPHFFVFCQLQLGRPMVSWTEHWENAVKIAAIPEEQLKFMTVEDFRKAGVIGI